LRAESNREDIEFIGCRDLRSLSLPASLTLRSHSAPGETMLITSVIFEYFSIAFVNCASRVYSRHMLHNCRILALTELGHWFAQFTFQLQIARLFA
jgi:hypothetical protein